jgi:hypothetical protein
MIYLRLRGWLAATLGQLEQLCRPVVLTGPAGVTGMPRDAEELVGFQKRLRIG